MLFLFITEPKKPKQKIHEQSNSKQVQCSNGSPVLRLTSQKSQK